MTAWLLPLAVGFATGILSAWGVGGGTLLLLCMTLLLGVDQRTAQTRGRGIAQQLNGSFAVQQGRFALIAGRKRGRRNAREQGSSQTDRTRPGAFQERTTRQRLRHRGIPPCKGKVSLYTIVNSGHPVKAFARNFPFFAAKMPSGSSFVPGGKDFAGL